MKLHEDLEVLDFDEYMSMLRLSKLADMYAGIPGQESSKEEIFDALCETEKYNNSVYAETDKNLIYDDEIIEIIELDEAETMDISVAGDQLFYANGILTKNSAGLSHTADFILAVIETEDLAVQGIQLLKQIKSRYGDKMSNNKFNMGVKKGNQRWYEQDGPSAPRIPELSDDDIISECVKARDTIPITEASAELDKMAELDKINKPAASRSELDELADSLLF